MIDISNIFGLYILLCHENELYAATNYDPAVDMKNQTILRVSLAPSNWEVLNFC